MAPLTPTWAQPSHPAIQEVIYASKDQFLTKSISKITLQPYALYARMEFPPCTRTSEPTYATVQIGRDEHLDLNSDLVYINHSCQPSLIFNTTTLSIIAGPHGLSVGDELTFFYPSTEWAMSQPFACFCGTASCRGTISGARDMPPADMEGYFLNEHVRDMLMERDGSVPRDTSDLGPLTVAVAGAGAGADRAHQMETKRQRAHSVGTCDAEIDFLEMGLYDSVEHARAMVAKAEKLLKLYIAQKGRSNRPKLQNGVEEAALQQQHILGSREVGADVGADVRRGVTSRELSGEMGGDTVDTV